MSIILFYYYYFFRGVAKLGKALDFDSNMRGFKSLHLYFFNIQSIYYLILEVWPNWTKAVDCKSIPVKGCGFESHHFQKPCSSIGGAYDC